MKIFKHVIILAITLTACISEENQPLSTGTTAQALTTCGTSGDKDGDGVSDALDNSVMDACTCGAGTDRECSGHEDCSTGEGNGEDDCE